MGTRVASVSATDGDVDENGIVHYFIADGNQLKVFEMEQGTGDLMVAVKLVITAEDLGECIRAHITFGGMTYDIDE